MATWLGLAEMSTQIEKDHYFTPELETAAIENPLYRGSIYYENLTDFLPIPSKIL
jgi:hypothetical protein